MKSRLIFTIFALFVSLLLLPHVSSAQIPTSIDGIQISISPEIPNPGQKVVVSVESFSTDINAASIVWIVDGKTITKGIGVKDFTVTAPPLGKSMVVQAAMKTVEGREVKKEIKIKTGGVDLIWESDGYVPPFYKGRTFYAYENPVHITAMPHLAGSNGAEIDPKALLYKWTVNDKVIQDQSGYGRQSLTIQDEDLPRELDIKVEVSTSDGLGKASARINLTPGNPSISFYEEDPLYGVFYNKAILDRVNLLNQEVSIRAVPFTFNIFSGKPLTFNWSVNGLARTDLSTNESITLRTKGDNEGTSNISLSIRNENSILQGAERAFNVSFKKKDTSNSVFQ
jgi:hypothetical protein